MDIKALSHGEVSEAVVLSRQAGWNQLPIDWHRLIELDHEGCLGGWIEDSLVATSTVLTFPSGESWIGMVLVDETYRNNGYGTEIFHRALSVARDRSGDSIGLDATDAGQSIYESAGFVQECEIARWVGVLDFDQSIEGSWGVLPGIQNVVDFDYEVVETDRCSLLRRLCSEPRVTPVGYRQSGSLRGYAIVRPGQEHWQIGPLVALGERAAEATLAAASEVIGGESVIVDAPGDVDSLLRANGLSIQRHLTRMTYRTPQSFLLNQNVWGVAGFELG